MKMFSRNKRCNILIFTTFVLSTIAFSSCQPYTSTQKKTKDGVNNSNKATINSNIQTLPPVLDLFSCKPAETAFVAAHRGTHIGSLFPENALISLEALVKNKVLFAEIDVARLSDGTHIVFHDGVWDQRATGPNGILSLPLAATTWQQSQKLLLRDTSGKVTSSRPSSFNDILTYAKNKIYLEIDFKSSASEVEILKSIRAHNMLEQVVLISYSTEQALRLHKLAPNAVISVGIFKPADIQTLVSQGLPTRVIAAWTGKKPLSKSLTKALRSHGIPILAASFFSLDEEVKRTKNLDLYAEFAKLPDLVVTDSAFDVQKVLKFTDKYRKTMKKCLYEKQTF